MRPAALASLCSSLLALSLVAPLQAATLTGSAHGEFARVDSNWLSVYQIKNHDLGAKARFNWGSTSSCGGCTPFANNFKFDGTGSDGDTWQADTGTPFSLGTFTYTNGSVLAGSEVDGVGFDLHINLEGLGSTLFSLDFAIINTPNIHGTSAGDADQVALINWVGPVQWSTPKELWTLNLLGFSRDGGLSFATATDSPEGSQTRAEIFARVDHSLLAVPLPGSGWLLGVGLVGLVGAGSTKRRE